MKHAALILLALLLVAGACWGQDNILYRDSATLAWDAVTTDVDGDPLLATDVVEYEVFLYDSNDPTVTDDQDPAQLIAAGTTATTEQLLDFSTLDRAAYYAGVRAKVTDGQGDVTTSPIAWSYDAAAVDPTATPFAYIPLSGVLILPAPTGLKDAGM